jgi:hypothetical protein
MAKAFSVRVELHGDADYELLHASMHEVGFRRVVLGDKGVMSRLPTGSYYIDNLDDAVSAVTIRDTVMKLAAPFSYGALPNVWVVEAVIWAGCLTTVSSDPDAGSAESRLQNPFDVVSKFAK